ncbi:MAG: four helix bundle protein [Bacteroidota bacterium]
MAWKDIEDLEIYRLGMQIGNTTYELVRNWGKFDKNTLGYQLVRAVDSIPANISEGYGRFHYKEQRQFCYIARGSLYETKTWLTKALVRIPTEQESILEIMEILNTLHKKLNAYIKYIEKHI